MSKANDGGPAFAGSIGNVPAGQWASAHQGMSLRDWFAGLAMNGYLANSNGGDDIEGRVVYAYEVADGMLRAREEAVSK